MVQPNRCEITITAMEKDYFTHPTAIVEEGAKIGAGTKIWCFSHIMEGAVLGEKCSIGQCGDWTRCDFGEELQAAEPYLYRDRT